MQELRALRNRIADSYRDCDELMLAFATSNALSRHDMAAATGLAESRVNQIVRELAELHQDRRNAAAAELVARHMPQGSRLCRVNILSRCASMNSLNQHGSGCQLESARPSLRMTENRIRVKRS